VSRLLMSNNILVSCIHGCGVKDTLDLVGKHEDSCMMGMVKCNNQGCLSRVMFREMQEHLQNFIYRPRACPCCKESFSTKAWTSGHPNCFKRLEGGKLRLKSGPHAMGLVGEGERQVFVCYDLSGGSRKVTMLAGSFMELGQEDRQLRVCLGGGLITALIPVRSVMDIRQEHGAYGYGEFEFKAPVELVDVEITLGQT
jgi:hypothetical protein